LTIAAVGRLDISGIKGNVVMKDIAHRFIETNGIRMHVVEQGTGPLVLLCHGFPESWYSWRHQLGALAAAGFHVVAPDMRGYGQTEAPEAIDQYSMLHLVGDMVGLLDALGEAPAVIAGHDWGGPVAWYSALLRPDRFRAVIGLSVPYRPRGKLRPTSVMPRTDDAVFYQLYFQTPGVAEADLEADVRTSIRGVVLDNAGEAPRGSGDFSMVPKLGGMRARIQAASLAPLPGWLTEADIDFYAAEFHRTGFRGGLNWYRNIDRNWETLAPFAGAQVSVPALYVVGERDLVLTFPGGREMVANMPAVVPRLRQTLMLPGCGHWTQQERPDAVNAAIIGFLHGL
jgi:pimeloyl-ACP methyl ester carboxylesterase